MAGGDIEPFHGRGIYERKKPFSTTGSEIAKSLNFSSDVNKLYGKRKEILSYIKENKLMCVEDTNELGVDGKRFHIKLPPVGESEGVTFSGFISDKYYTKSYYQSKEELVKKSKSIEKLCELLKSINEWMKGMGLKGDENDDYKVLIGEGVFLQYEAGNFLKKMGGKVSWDMMFLNDVMFLSDVGPENSCAVFNCLYGCCQFGYFYSDKNVARIFLD